MKFMITTLLTCTALVGSGIGYAYVAFVPATQYEKHLENEESRYVLALKKEIRGVQAELRKRPSDDLLLEALADMIDTLCELRPNDKICK